MYVGVRDALLMKNFFTSFSAHFQLCNAVHLLFCCVSAGVVDWSKYNAVCPGDLFQMQACPQSALQLDYENSWSEDIAKCIWRASCWGKKMKSSWTALATKESGFVPLALLTVSFETWYLQSVPECFHQRTKYTVCLKSCLRTACSGATNNKYFFLPYP